MSQPREKALAGAAVIQSVLVQCLREGVARGGADGGNPEVGPKAPAVTLGALPPLRGSIFQLADPGTDCGDDDGIRTVSFKEIVLQLGFF